MPETNFGTGRDNFYLDKSEKTIYDYNYNKPASYKWSDEEVAAYKLTHPSWQKEGQLGKRPEQQAAVPAESKRLEQQAAVLAESKLVGWATTGQEGRVQPIYPQGEGMDEQSAMYVRSAMPKVSTRERSAYLRGHPLGGGQTEEGKMRSLKSTEDLESYMQTPSGLQIFGPESGEGASSTQRQYGEAILGQFNPELLEKYKAESSEERRSEGGMSYFYKTSVDPNTTLSRAEQAAEVRENPSLFTRYNALTPEERTQNLESIARSFKEDVTSQIRIRGKEISRMTTKEEYERYRKSLESGEVFGSFIEARQGAEEALRVSNPELYREIQDEKLLSDYEPLTADAKRIRISVGKEASGKDVYVTAGEAERRARRGLLVAKKMTGANREAAILKADTMLGEIYDSVSQRLKQVSAISEFGSAEELAETSKSGETPTFRKEARGALIREIGRDNAGLVFNDYVMSADVTPFNIAIQSGIVEEESANLKGGAVVSRRSNSDIAKQIIIDMKETLAGKTDVTQKEISSIMSDSMKKILKDKSLGVTVYGKGEGEVKAGDEFVKDLEWAVKYEFDEQAKSVFKGYNETVSRKLLPAVNKFLEQAPVVSRWNDNNAENALKRIDFAMRDPNFRIEYDFDKSGSIDRPEELAAAYMVLTGGSDAKFLSQKLMQGDASLLGEDDNAQQTTDAFNDLGFKLHGARIAYIKKEEAEELLPQRMEEERTRISNFNLSKGLLTTFSNDPTKTDIAATFLNDARGVQEKNEYLNAPSSALREQVLVNSKTRLREFGATESKAEKAIPLIRSGYLPKWSAVVVKTEDPNVPFITKLVVKNEAATSEEDWINYDQDILDTYGEYPEIYAKVKQEKDNARNLWKEGDIAREYGYSLDKLSPESKAFATKIREEQDSGRNGWFFGVGRGEIEAAMWEDFANSLPEGKKKSLEREGFPLRLEAENPELFYDTIEEERVKAEADEAAEIIKKSGVSGEPSVRMTAPDGKTTALVKKSQVEKYLKIGATVAK